MSVVQPRHPRRGVAAENGPRPGELVGSASETTHAAGSVRARAATRAALAAFWWALAFTGLHAYWFAGGRIGFGDQADPLPGWPSSVGGWTFEVVVLVMFAAGLVVPLAFTRRWGLCCPRALLLWLMRIGAAVLLARGGSGLVDDVLRFSGLVRGGLTGLSNQDVLGSAHPTTVTKLSTVAIDLVFVVGGVLFAGAARLGGSRAAAES
ncbi:MAG TPA: DUF3995 domain-containing protein [Marmoricola sp.]|jgi:hypothetical protein|nr:DUF3995 domain-containing protein [Marmoricola sp.]